MRTYYPTARVGSTRTASSKADDDGDLDLGSGGPHVMAGQFACAPTVGGRSNAQSIWSGMLERVSCISEAVMDVALCGLR